MNKNMEQEYIEIPNCNEITHSDIESLENIKSKLCSFSDKQVIQKVIDLHKPINYYNKIHKLIIRDNTTNEIIGGYQPIKNTKTQEIGLWCFWDNKFISEKDVTKYLEKIKTYDTRTNK